MNTQKLGWALALCVLSSSAIAAEIQYRDPGESMALVDTLPDIRQAADDAMKKCQPVIDELKSLVTKAGFDPGFGTQFAHSAQSRAVRMLIPELALRKSGH